MRRRLFSPDTFESEDTFPDFKRVSRRMNHTATKHAGKWLTAQAFMLRARSVERTGNLVTIECPSEIDAEQLVRLMLNGREGK